MGSLCKCEVWYGTALTCVWNAVQNGSFSQQATCLSTHIIHQIWTQHLFHSRYIMFRFGSVTLKIAHIAYEHSKYGLPELSLRTRYWIFTIEIRHIIIPGRKKNEIAWWEWCTFQSQDMKWWKVIVKYHRMLQKAPLSYWIYFCVFTWDFMLFRHTVSPSQPCGAQSIEHTSPCLSLSLSLSVSLSLSLSVTLHSCIPNLSIVTDSYIGGPGTEEQRGEERRNVWPRYPLFSLQSAGLLLQRCESLT